MPGNAQGLPVGSVVKNPPAMQKAQEMPWVQPLGWEDPREEGMATHSSILAFENPADRGTWQATIHRLTQLDMIEVTENTDVRDFGSIPGSEKFPGEGNGNPLQYFCLENPIDRGDWQATVHKASKSWT